ncbi:DUF4292 domain-containing protein [Fodinibius salsisoli]|uniref:DUF4292 domain-containing protein n=1 Tax=Fodinibius salsisoli TaxID=2820877 RepID=A0ABT3PS61_9BACT|nr:DUF4292 domain-containing protein [Fodinibius salsisoli]MCW9708700.1 DUF4292 domain-containing protein [Fodinibius salsisoli]
MGAIRRYQFKILTLLLGCTLFISCSSPQKLSKEGFRTSSVSAESIVNSLPNYTKELKTVEGKGRAIVSEPNNTDRITLLFSSNRLKSLVTVRNGIGIEGGQLLTDGDTLLVYNKIDNYARKIPVRGGKLTRINKLASLNILNILNYTIDPEEVTNVWENETHFKLMLTTGAQIFVEKAARVVDEVMQPEDSSLPYSRIQYGAYSNLEQFTLPRKIAIFGTEGKSKIALQLQSLQLNPSLNQLTINLPDDIRIYYR